MGLASSQARMLLLTARKSDLEYRAQAISQRKMNIAMQTEQLATEYSAARSNRRMSLEVWESVAEGTKVKEDLSLAGLVGVGTTVSGNYLVTDASGKYVYSDEATMIAVMEKMAQMDGRDIYTYKEVETKNEKGETVVTKQRDGYNKTLMAELSQKMTLIPDAKNNSFFQDALRNGSLFLKQLSTQESTDTTKVYNTIHWGSAATISDAYDTSDDAAAEAKYESESLVLSNQDKMLDLELNQIQTQHSAIENEYDSVRKVIDKNIEKSFKIFS